MAGWESSAIRAKWTSQPRTVRTAQMHGEIAGLLARTFRQVGFGGVSAAYLWEHAAAERGGQELGVGSESARFLNRRERGAHFV